MEFKSTNIKSQCIRKTITSKLMCNNHISNIRITKEFPCFTKRSVLTQKHGTLIDDTAYISPFLHLYPPRWFVLPTCITWYNVPLNVPMALDKSDSAQNVHANKVSHKIKSGNNINKISTKIQSAWNQPKNSENNFLKNK